MYFLAEPPYNQSMCSNCGSIMIAPTEIHYHSIIQYYSDKLGLNEDSPIPVFCSKRCVNLMIHNKLGITEEELKAYEGT